MWIKFPSLKMLWNAHVPITPWWYRRELWGHVFGCSCACVCSGLPDCLRAAFVPALIRCQWGLAGSWHPDTSPSIRWHYMVGGIKNDPIRGWQCVLTGTTCLGVFNHSAVFFFLSFCLLCTFKLFTLCLCFPCWNFCSQLVTMAQKWVGLPVLTPSFYVSFSCLL